MTRRTITTGSAIAAFAMTGGLAAPAAGAVSSDASCVGQHAGTVAPTVRQDFGAVNPRRLADGASREAGEERPLANPGISPGLAVRPSPHG
jgi:hypothetical protein